MVAGAPTIVRADRGTENSVIAFIQPAFRSQQNDSFVGERSFCYLKSTSNQVGTHHVNDQ